MRTTSLRAARSAGLAAPSARSLEVSRPIEIAAEDGDARSGRPGLQQPARDRRGSHSRAENAEHAWKSMPPARR